MSFKKVTIALVVGAITAIIFLKLTREKTTIATQESLPSTIPQSPIDSSKNKQSKQSGTQESYSTPALASPITVCEMPFKEVPDKEAFVPIETDSLKLEQVIASTQTLESEFTTLLTTIDDPDKRVEGLSQINDKYPGTPLISYELLSVCTRSDANCSAELIASTVQQDPDNGAAWLLAAIYHASHSNSQAAEAAIIEASKAPNFDDHWSDYSATMAAAYEQAGAVNGNELDVLMMGNTAALASPSYGALFKLCKQTSVDNTALLDACLTSGQLFAQKSSTQISQFIGSNIQKEILTKLNDTEELARVMQVRKEMFEANDKQTNALGLIWRNQSLRDEWQTELIRNGEVKAAEFAISEALRISNDPNIDECLTVN